MPPSPCKNREGRLHTGYTVPFFIFKPFQTKEFCYVSLYSVQCLSQSRGLNCCPDWVTEQCCGSCCGTAEGQRSCLCVVLIAFAEMCNCAPPSKKSCMDSVCPTKEVRLDVHLSEMKCHKDVWWHNSIQYNTTHTHKWNYLQTDYWIASSFSVTRTWRSSLINK